MTEQEFLSNQSNVPNATERQTGPDFALHIPREGEPIAPPPKQMSSLKGEELNSYIKWTGWAEQQPDRLMLLDEWITRGYLEHGSMTQDDIPVILESLAQLAVGLRTKGHGELLDKYWPHIKPYEAQAKPLGTHVK